MIVSNGVPRRDIHLVLMVESQQKKILITLCFNINITIILTSK